MKKNLLVIFAGVLILAACGKDQDLSGYLTREDFENWQNEHGQDQGQSADTIDLVTVKTFNVAFPAANDVNEVTTTYSGLQGILKQDDVLLVYFNMSSYGMNGWMQLPFEFGNISMVYWRDSNGKLTFRKGRGLHVAFTDPAETLPAKAVIIPATVYSSKCAAGVNHDDYEEVIAAYGLSETITQ